MMVLHVSGLHFRYSTHAEWLLSNTAFDINAGDRIAVVGNNGSGKTTLLDLLAGRHRPGRGQIVNRSGLQVAQVHQELLAPELATLLDIAAAVDDAALDLAVRLRVLEGETRPDESTALDYAATLDEFGSIDGWGTRALAAQVLRELGVPELVHEVPFTHASGGERSIAQLARALVTPADLLLIDEPTNHLDMRARQWLGGYMVGLGRSIVFASHDRAFLTQVATRVIELRDGTAFPYSLDWPSFVGQREIERRQAWADYTAGQRRRRATERAVANRERKARSMLTGPDGRETRGDYLRARAKRVERTAKVIRRRLEQQPPAPKPVTPDPVGNLTFPKVDRGPDIVVAARDVAITLGCASALDAVTFEVARGERIHLAGCNGAGKTTLLRIIAGQLSATRGSAHIGAGVTIGLFTQDALNLDPALSPLEHALAICPDRSWVTTVLACLRIRDRELHAPVAHLSPGRRSTTALALTVLSGANLLLLDEPTNHLDLDTQVAFGKTLLRYPGTIVFSSHDRVFAQTLATRTIDLD